MGAEGARREDGAMNNVDAAELRRFDAVAARWWDPDGPFRPLHDLNPVRLAYIEQRARLRSAQVVDIGCGGGILAEALARKGAQVTGIDLARDALDVARLHALEENVRVNYREASVEMLADELPGAFDIATCLEMIEHVPDPQSVLHAAMALVKPGGWVFVSTLNRTARAFALGIVGAEYLLGLLPRGTHRYDRFIKPSELRRGLVAAGAIDIEFHGVSYDPLTRQAALGDDLSINYLCAARRPA
jgi:2-polyprenyl-6-hydroxyphenyl methylase/3-demethylubiquinone-9 3-methyltransferase